MQNLKYTLAHGSRNVFVLIDAVEYSIDTNNAGEYVRQICDKFQSDGALFLEQVCGVGDDADRMFYAMNMYNTDGSQAQMCGNGMRIVARMADERYLHSESFTLYSGGRPYAIRRGEDIVATLDGGEVVRVPSYGISIAIRRAAGDFTLSDSQFIAESIPELHPTLKFTYLNLGNPHIVAEVESVDLDALSRLGERVKELKSIFPEGVNVSFMQPIERNRVFVATYERGVGLTASCGTAMTASSTTATLLGYCDWDADIEVRNRGGFVHCCCHMDGDGALTTELIGNASYIEEGVISSDIEVSVKRVYTQEIEAWDILTKK